VSVELGGADCGKRGLRARIACAGSLREAFSFHRATSFVISFITAYSLSLREALAFDRETALVA
jgi:hypothetical protein